MTISKNANTSHILGIDYGQSKIGLAIADSETRIASGYAVLDNDKNFLPKLAEIVEKEGISKIIIGEIQYPSVASRHLPSSEGRKFGEWLANNLKIEVEYKNEMFTTRQAHQNLIEKGMKGIKRFDDQEAARIILQSWLDSKVRP